MVKYTDSSPIPYAHVVNLRNGQGDISNREGYFIIPVKVNDTIRISAIAYHEIYYEITGSELIRIDIPQIKMKEKVFMINEVEVKGISWNSFKNAIKTMKLPEKEDKYSGKTLQLFNSEQIQNLVANSTKTGIPFQLRSKQDRSREKVDELIVQDKMNKIARNKLIDLIDSFTEMDGKQIENFIRFCKIPRSFVLNSNDYDILIVLEKKFKEYKK